MKCWKCEKETGGPLPECVQCGAEPTLEITTNEPSYELDFMKVASVDEMRTILASLNIKVFIGESHPNFDQLRQWLKF